MPALGNLATLIKPYWDLLSRHIRPQSGRFLFLTILLFGSIGLQIINPQILRAFIDTALATDPMDGEVGSRLLLSALAFISIALLQQGVAVWVTYLGQNVAWTATNALRAELAWHCLNLDMSFHNENTPGVLIERIDGDVAELANFFSQFVIVLVSNVLLMIGILFALFLEDWRVGLAFTVFAFIAITALGRVRDIAVPHQKARRQAEANLFGFVEEHLSNREDICSNGAVGYSIRELFRLQREVLQHDRKAHYKNWLLNLLMGALLTLGNILAFAAGYTFYVSGLITIGTVYLFIHYFNLLEQPIWMLTREIEGFQTISACVERLKELLAVRSKISDGAGVTLPGGAVRLAFDRISFGYNGDELVLKDLSFQLESGKVLGLLGRTGSGKSTLARLIFRLYDPAQGNILLQNTNLREASLADLHKRVAMVTQEVQLFRASVRDNLTFFDTSIDDEQIRAVITELGLADWLASLPQGLGTLLESGSYSLSAGEAQLLAFTRVFLRDPGLVILDEASSRLDPVTEQRIERAMEKLLQGRTAVIIAHRLGTVQRADEIMILDRGNLCEFGDRVQLSCDPGSRFYHLLQSGLEEVLA